jgi:excisionase family DNA binding protein
VQAKVQIADGLLNLKEAAAFLQVKERTLRELCHDNRITHIRLNHRQYRFKPEHLEEFVARRTHRSKGVYV